MPSARRCAAATAAMCLVITWSGLLNTLQCDVMALRAVGGGHQVVYAAGHAAHTYDGAVTGAPIATLLCRLAATAAAGGGAAGIAQRALRWRAACDAAAALPLPAQGASLLRQFQYAAAHLPQLAAYTVLLRRQLLLVGVAASGCVAMLLLLCGTARSARARFALLLAHRMLLGGLAAMMAAQLVRLADRGAPPAMPAACAGAPDAPQCARAWEACSAALLAPLVQQSVGGLTSALVLDTLLCGVPMAASLPAMATLWVVTTGVNPYFSNTARRLASACPPDLLHQAAQQSSGAGWLISRWVAIILVWSGLLLFAVRWGLQHPGEAAQQQRRQAVPPPRQQQQQQPPGSCKPCAAAAASISGWAGVAMPQECTADVSAGCDQATTEQRAPAAGTAPQARGEPDITAQATAALSSAVQAAVARTAAASGGVPAQAARAGATRGLAAPTSLLYRTQTQSLTLMFAFAPRDNPSADAALQGEGTLEALVHAALEQALAQVATQQGLHILNRSIAMWPASGCFETVIMLQFLPQ